MQSLRYTFIQNGADDFSQPACGLKILLIKAEKAAGPMEVLFY